MVITSVLLLRQKKIAPMLGERVDDDSVAVHPSERGRLKQALLKVGWPAEDLAGYVDGEAHAIDLKQDGWVLRETAADTVAAQPVFGVVLRDRAVMPDRCCVCGEASTREVTDSVLAALAAQQRAAA